MSNDPVAATGCRWCGYVPADEEHACSRFGEAPPDDPSAAPEQEFTDEQLRQFLLDALNGRPVGSDVAWEIVKRWDSTRPKAHHEPTPDSKLWTLPGEVSDADA